MSECVYYSCQTDSLRVPDKPRECKPSHHFDRSKRLITHLLFALSLSELLERGDAGDRGRGREREREGWGERKGGREMEREG